ncbi:peroxisomal acyl-coenzyme A oxidase 3-like isoform X1 [Vanessa atalanta]|uniref:peroxisomal acyl-coenzyme A oxidase 3-like isoform X1 n=1 Tax=Vanessa atalanta TaxID=42275 RepID=UPI001FCCC9C2|nr:peroxisomal acyl-coenzyme A oxidase 3-like isoform X1 [Vanessa atalanta]XP_047528095.1 peroxisomal acyl-coenzyme A oxidase 3-like isoform X1 [Vanessa atalanta]
MESSKKLVMDELKTYFPDLPNGPLDNYRKKATFNWRVMKLVYDNMTTIKLKHDMWRFMENNPLFQHSDTSLSLDEERRIAVKRMYAIFNENFLPSELLVEEPKSFQAWSEALFMFNSSLAVKISLTFRMFSNTIQGSGGPHLYDFIEASEKGEIGGCFALTEVSHGSNAKGMRTTATYCPKKKQFVIHSADFEAAKFWVGSLGKCATHAIVYAMLISKGKNHGLHAFVVPIRDPKTLKPFPGVTIGDIGEKIGLNGVDNGFVMFDNYHIPKEYALDKLGGVDDNGDYKTPFRDPSKRFGASLGILSGGRVHITSISTNYLQKAIVIAIRYSAVRKQFGPQDAAEETPVLEYQQQQVRLLPYLATTFAFRIFCTWFGDLHVRITIDSLLGRAGAAARGVELHALSASAKPLCAWAARDAIQACREAAGGHGYLRAAGLGDLRNDNDANCTYEGENSLLLQQSSNWLLTMWPKRREIKDEDTPLGSLKFLENADEYLTTTCPWTTVDELIDPCNLIQMYKWLTAYVLKMTYEKVSKLKSEGKDNLQAKNESQSYNAVSLSVIYGENYILNHFYKTAKAFEDAACREVLLQMVSLYGAFLLEKHMATLYIGGYLRAQAGAALREGVLRACAALRPHAPALADTLAPPDFCLNSVLGMADGQVYKHIQNKVMTSPGSMTRPAWWRDVVQWRARLPSKL